MLTAREVVAPVKQSQAMAADSTKFLVIALFPRPPLTARANVMRLRPNNSVLVLRS